MKAYLIPSFIIITAGLCATPLIHAQEVIVSPPFFYHEEDIPERLPQIDGKWTPSFPHELRMISSPGYAFLYHIPEMDGRLLRRPFIAATNNLFGEAVRERYGKLKYLSPKRGGSLPGGGFYTCIVFNPSHNKNSSGVRLIEARPVFAELEKIKQIGKRPRVIPLEITVGKDGKSNGFSIPVGSEHAKLFKTEIEESLALWKFTPAGEDIETTERSIEIPVILLVPFPSAKERAELLAKRGDFVPAKPIKQVEPAYPRIMAKLNIEGEVVIHGNISVEGKVKNPIVVLSNNPAFEEPALDAILEWKFQPAKKDGIPIETHFIQPMVFQSSYASARNIFSISPMSEEQKKRLPKEYHFDIPPKIRGVILPVFPYDLLKGKIYGEATVVMLVDSNGRVIQSQVSKASAPEFGQALIAATNHYVFKHAIRDGIPTPTVISRTEFFDTNSIPDEELDMLKIEQKQPEKIIPATELLHPPKAISMREAKFPLHLIKQGYTEGSATVVLIIDKHGFVRLPRFTKATHPDFGYAAVQAVSLWRFEVPRSKDNKKPVITKVMLPVEFKLRDE